VSTIVELLHHRWAPAVLAELDRTSGSRFVTLAHRLGTSRESLRRTLAALIENSLVTRNPGHGHPLRPEYVLTSRGAAVAPFCADLLSALEAARATEIGLKKWSMPTLLAIGVEACHYSKLLERLPGITSRSLSLALKDLQAAELVSREVTLDFPPATLYRATRKADPILRVLCRFG
jgi:DNA-binding HxlR family transcriptional regulator